MMYAHFFGPSRALQLKRMQGIVATKTPKVKMMSDINAEGLATFCIFTVRVFPQKFKNSGSLYGYASQDYVM